MIVARIDGTTRVLGRSQGYLGLPVRDGESDNGRPIMTTAWEPTPDEVVAIVAGAKVEVIIMGDQHPPIKVVVGKPGG